MLLTILGGSVQKNPTNQFYYLQADTSNIPGAAQLTRWTTWNACGVTNGRNLCPGVHPAYAFDPPRNFGTTQGVPPQFIGTRKYYYLTRFMFAFHLIALFFSVCALFTGLLALCSRIGSFLSSFTCSIALFFQTITAALMTYVLSLLLPLLPCPQSPPSLPSKPSPSRKEKKRELTPSPQQRSIHPRPQRLSLVLPLRLSRPLQLRLHVGGRSMPLHLHHTAVCRRGGVSREQ